MKSGWANGLRGIFALALLTGAAPTHAQTPQGTSVEGVAKEEPKIVAIRIVKEDGQVLSDSPTGIAVESGKALDRGEIADRTWPSSLTIRIATIFGSSFAT